MPPHDESSESADLTEFARRSTGEPDGSARRVRVAVVDSGIHPGHPHIGGVQGGISFISPGQPDDDYLDRLGHGTAVAAAIREKAPEVELFAVKIFDRSLGTSIDRLITAVGWAVDAGMDIINLSLGTARHEHREALTALVARAAARGALIVSAAEDEGVEWLPGALPGVVPVRLDWDCPRDEYRVERRDGRPIFVASGFPRTIPGVPPMRNLNGVSFAVANISGFLSRRLQATRPPSFDAAIASLIHGAANADVDDVTAAAPAPVPTSRRTDR
jgi:subtilisin family serine protease